MSQSKYKQGAYELTELHDADDGTVVLDSNHKKNYWGDE